MTFLFWVVFFSTYKHHGSPPPGWCGSLVDAWKKRLRDAGWGKLGGEFQDFHGFLLLVSVLFFFVEMEMFFWVLGVIFCYKLEMDYTYFFFRSFSWNIFWNKASLYVFVTVSSENVWGSKYCWPETLGLAGHGTHPMFSNLAFRPAFLCDHLFQLVGSNATQQVEFHLLVTPNPVSSGQEARGQPAGVAVSERGTPPTV